MNDYKYLMDYYTICPGVEREKIASDLALLASYNDLAITLKILDAPPRKRIVFESGEMTSGVPEHVTRHENITDMSGESPNQVSAGMSGLLVNGSKQTLKLSNFLSRPIKIWESPITMTTFTKFDIPAWDIFTKDPTVRAKLRNYAYLKGDLKVRISISATPFHYGKLLVAYHPYANYNSALQSHNVLYNPAELTTIDAMNCYLSQSPGATTIDIRHNRVLELTLPFIAPKPMHRLFNGNLAISDITSYNDMINAGNLIVSVLTPVRGVNGVIETPLMQIYAWMDEVELGPPTATVVAITTESDERETGPVEEISSALARATGALSKAPYIGKFALASSIGFGSLARISALYGWSKPSVIEDPLFVKNNAFQSSALMTTHDTSLRIAADPKRELSINPGNAACDSDHLVISTLASTWSYLDYIVWDTTAAPLQPWHSIAMTPNLGVVGNALGTYTQPSAMMFAALPFEYWKGDIEIRFDVACSQFHRGKFIVGYEPNANASSLFLSSPIKLNKQFQHIVDIQETQTITFRVNWNAISPWLRTPQTAIGHHGSGAPAYNNLFHNGFIYIAPFTKLIAPDNTSPVRIAIFVRSPNLQVNMLGRNSRLPRRYNITTESAEEIVSTMNLNDPIEEKSHTSLEYFGEEVVSFRSALKRYMLEQTVYRTDLIARSSHCNIFARGQIYPIVGPNYSTITPTAYSSLFHYLRFAYLGVRGSVRKRIAPMLHGPVNEHFGINVTLDAPTLGTSNLSIDCFNITENSIRDVTPNSIGSVTFDRESNGAIEVELPFYSRNLFAFSFNNEYCKEAGQVVDQWEYDQNWPNNFIFGALLHSATAQHVALGISNAVGEDFDFIRFQGSPPYKN